MNGPDAGCVLCSLSRNQAALPFAIVGSEDEVVIDGRRIRCRQYPWGIVEGNAHNSPSSISPSPLLLKPNPPLPLSPIFPVDNARHCDFSQLRYSLLSSHLHDLKEITHDFLYEQYRTETLSGGNGGEEEVEDVVVDDADDDEAPLRA